MFPLILSLCYASIFCGCVSGYSDEDYAVYFPNHGVTDYVNIWGMPSLTQITVCFWAKSNTATGTAFSYSVPGRNNEFLIYNFGNFEISINNVVGAETGTSANDGKWHHICFSWQSSDGAWKFYKDGQKKSQGTFERGHTIQGGGSLVLGQEQDSLGGGFQAQDSYQGYLANVNVWSYVLPEHEIRHQSGSGSCLTGEGNVYKWSDFKGGLRGGVRLFIPSPCSPGN